MNSQQGKDQEKTPSASDASSTPNRQAEREGKQGGPVRQGTDQEARARQSAGDSAMNARIRPTDGGPTERPIVEGGRAVHPGETIGKPAGTTAGGNRQGGEPGQKR